VADKESTSAREKKLIQLPASSVCGGWAGIDLGGIHREISFLIKFLKAQLKDGNDRGRLDFILIWACIARTNAEVDEKTPNSIVDIVRLYQSGNDFFEAKNNLICLWHFFPLFS
jgi:hypothetical protein